MDCLKKETQQSLFRFLTPIDKTLHAGKTNSHNEARNEKNTGDVTWIGIQNKDNINR